MQFFKRISGVLQIFKNAIEKKISGVLQIMHLESTFSRGTLVSEIMSENRQS
jgi:hypothetical protein